MIEELQMQITFHPRVPRNAAGFLRIQAVPKKRIRPEIHRDRSEVPQEVRRAIDSCCTGQSAWPLLLFGSTGVGKTCAGLALCDHAAGSSSFRDVDDLADVFGAVRNGKRRAVAGLDCESIADFDRAIRATQLMVIDELAIRGKVSDNQYQAIKRVLDVRQNRPLMLLSNLGPDEIADVYDDRIASRCSAGSLLEWNGPDRRLER